MIVGGTVVASAYAAIVFSAYRIRAAAKRMKHWSEVVQDVQRQIHAALLFQVVCTTRTRQNNDAIDPIYWSAPKKNIARKRSSFFSPLVKSERNPPLSLLFVSRYLRSPLPLMLYPLNLSLLFRQQHPFCSTSSLLA